MRLVTALTLALVASSAFAQSVTTIDLSTLNLGIIAAPQAVDTDGNPETQEWLIHRLFTQEYRVVAVTPAGLCVGNPFTVGPDWQVQRLGRVDAFTRMMWPHFDIMALLHPTC